MSFHVGQKVVCVDADPLPGRRCQPGHELTRGAVYTIRETGLTAYTGAPAVRLQEIFRDHTIPINDMPYLARRFRPLTETKSKISFTEGAPKDSEKWDNRVPQKVRA